jgi:hypothetical protein
MVDEPNPPQSGDPGNPHSFYQNFQHTPVGARVPEKIGRGVFTTAVMILQTNEIFLVDFLSMIVPPQQVVARIIMTASNFSQFLSALRLNLSHYEGQFGALAPRPGAGQRSAALATGEQPPGGAEAVPGVSMGGGMAGGQPQGPLAHGTSISTHPEAAGPTSITDLYDQLKFPEELLGGVFANAVMIRHTPDEFCFDFIANLFPRPVVATRVFTAARRVPSLIEAMAGSWERFQRGGQLPPPVPPATPEE